MFIRKFSGSISKGNSAVNKKQTNKPDKKKQNKDMYKKESNLLHNCQRSSSPGKFSLSFMVRLRFLFLFAGTAFHFYLI